MKAYTFDRTYEGLKHRAMAKMVQAPIPLLLTVPMRV